MSDAPAVGAVDSPANLRSLGRIRVLAALHEGGRLSRPDLVRRTGLARATVASVISDLVDAGIAGDHEAAPATHLTRNGRPPRTIGLLPSAAFAAGVDIGHDHVRCVLCDLTGAPVFDRIGRLAVDDAPEDALALAADFVAEASAQVAAERVLGVGVGIASPTDQRTGTLHADAIMPGWVGVQVVDELGCRTGLSVRLINDANAGALAERRYGAAQQCSDLVYVRLSSGIGAGVVCDGRMLFGTGGLAGEIGHLTVEPHGVVCRCGNRGCLETVASPAAIARLLEPSLGRRVSADELLTLVAAGHGGAIRAVEDAGDAVGRALAATVTLLNPELLVVGGDLAAAAETLFVPIRRAIERHAMSAHTAGLRITAGTLDDRACALGAAALVLAEAPQRLAGLAG